MSQPPQKLASKMCKSPKNTAATNNYQSYEHLSTNCTVVGSNNLNLVKKQPIAMSPAYSNPSPGGAYPPSPYSSPASMKSPSPSLKPPTPQPQQPQQPFPVMQIIHNAPHQLLARPIPQPNHHQGNIIKLKPHLNILPKPSASPQPSPKPSVSPQIVIPNQQATIMPTAQPMLLNQMPLITGPGVQFILRPQAKAPQQGLILQPGTHHHHHHHQPLLQLQPQPQRAPTPMVRVLTNGVQLAPATTTAYVTQSAPQPPPQQQQQQQQMVQQLAAKKVAKPKAKVKKKLDLANLMKLSGIGDEDDIQFESDASQQSESEPQIPEKKVNNVHVNQIQQQQQQQQQQPIQVLNQNFQNFAPNQQFNQFITPNFTINNGLMVQRTSGGFKLTVGEDGRLVLQHDPALNQDLQSQLILQSLFGLNGGGLVLQPSLAEQTTVQSVQTIQQQTVQSQTMQTVQQTVHHQSQQIMQQPMQLHSLIQNQIQGQIQSLLQQQQVQQQNQAVQTNFLAGQPILKVQPFQKAQPPVQTVHPQPQPPPPPQPTPDPPPPPPPPPPPTTNTPNNPTSYVVNLTPDQLEQLKRNGQLTVNGQTIFMQRPHQKDPDPPPPPPKKLSPKAHTRPPKKLISGPPTSAKKQNFEEGVKSSLIGAVKQPKAIVQPSVKEKTAKAIAPPPPPPPPSKVENNGANTDVASLLGQLIEESGNINIITSNSGVAPPMAANKNQRIHTIQLTPQKQEHLKNIQVQIQALSAQPGNSEIQQALKMLFAEQQKILATGKLLSPDKVYYHNNQLTIINPSTLSNNMVSGGGAGGGGGGGGGASNKCESGEVRAANQESRSSPAVTSQQLPVATSSPVVPVARISVTLPQPPQPPPPLSVTPAAAIPPPARSPQQNVHSTPSQMVIGPAVAATVTTPLPAPSATTAITIPKSHPQLTQAQQIAQQQYKQQQLAQSIAKKAHLIEQQLNLDQSGAIKPDIHTPFRDKKDACIRLVRYHCLDQPVLSQKDLAKADEIFEMTAKHFIGKYAKMVDKYKLLLMKESMRQVPTSELMMLDRMYLSEERQSLHRLRQDAEDASHALDAPPLASSSSSSSACPPGDDYDEWAGIQRELGCLHPQQQSTPSNHDQQPPTSSNKRTASSDSRLETLKRFRVDKHNKKAIGCEMVGGGSGQSGGGSGGGQQAFGMCSNQLGHYLNQSNLDIINNMNSSGGASCYNLSSGDDNEVENNSIDEQVQSAIDSILNLQQNTALDLDSILS